LLDHDLNSGGKDPLEDFFAAWFEQRRHRAAAEERGDHRTESHPPLATAPVSHRSTFR
jgi:heme-degrading monooxygenase HmoA